MGQSRSDTNFVAASITSSADFTRTGNFLHPGERNILTSSFKVSCNYELLRAYCFPYRLRTIQSSYTIIIEISFHQTYF